jgi:hypothetical protein
MKFSVIIALMGLHIFPVHALIQDPAPSLLVSKRQFLASLVTGSCGVSLLPKKSVAGVIQVTERCDGGIGDGCSNELDPPIIQELRKKSALNREARDAEDLRRYNMNNFKDFFAASYPPKTLVMYPATGKFAAVLDSEVKELVNLGKIKAGSAGSFQDNYASRVGYYFVDP